MQVTYIDHMGSDLSVVNAARVSFGKKSDWEWICEGCGISQGKSEYCVEGKEIPCNIFGVQPCTGFKQLNNGDFRLIKYLANHKHISPFNHTFITLHVKAPIFVARQLVKHKFMPWNEISRRYVDQEPEFYYPDKWRARAENKKQGSNEEEFIDNVEDIGLTNVINEQYDLYMNLLELGVAPEQARIVLPQNTYTEWYWSGTLGAYSDMYNLRSKIDTQLETRQVALQCGEIISKLFPVSWDALTNKAV